VNPILPLAMEMLIFAAIYLLASAVTWPLRRRCRHEDVLALGGGGCLRHVFAHMSRSLVVIAFTWLTVHLAMLMNWTGLFVPDEKHIEAWFRFWEFVLLIAFVEGLAVVFCRILKKPFPVPDLLLNILRGVLVVAALLAVLRFQLGMNISPVLGASALLTAVVGFALQGVLGNLLAGMSLHVVRSVVPGDWVAIGDIEGEVIQTNWRETRLRTVGGHIIVVPNSTVAAATIHNMSRPTPLRRHRIFVGASYSDAPADVIDALVQSALAVPEVLREPAPSAYLVEYKDFGINYALRFWTNRYYNRVPAEGDVMRMIWYQFKRRGIEIPFPMSDKLLNDLVEVIDHQRQRHPEESEVKRTANDLRRSDFVSRLLVDETGASLLKESDLSGLASSIRRIRFTKGETIFGQGEPGETCYVVVRGKARGRVEYKDVSQTNEFDLGPGSLFGEMSIVTGLPRTATVLAHEEVELLEISKDTFAMLLGFREDIPQVLAKLVAERAEHNKATLDKLKSLEASSINESIKSASILKRFLRMLGRGA
jgi:small-conductance mechanosensitive channel/CRP-like cAMP-binding protein